MIVVGLWLVILLVIFVFGVDYYISDIVMWIVELLEYIVIVGSGFIVVEFVYVFFVLGVWVILVIWGSCLLWYCDDIICEWFICIVLIKWELCIYCNVVDG